MSTPVGSSQWMYTPASGFYPYLIDQSLRFNDDDGPNLTQTYGGSGTSTALGTFSWWMKLGNVPSKSQENIYFESAGYGGIQLRSGKLATNGFDSSNTQVIVQTDALLRDPSSWYHCVVSVDGTAGTIKFYINGVEQAQTVSVGSLVAGRSWDMLGYDSRTNFTISNSSSANSFDGYLAEFHYIDGTALDATSFGETINGIWVPKEYSGSYGINGFYLSFADSAAIGDDLSGNTNDWTANNLAASDVVPDSPTNNFPTMNPLNWNVMTFSEGNLKLTTTTNSRGVHSTFAVPKSGKFYLEIEVDAYASGGGAFFGFCSNNNLGDNEYTITEGIHVYSYAGSVYVDNVVSTATGYTSKGANYSSSGDIYSLALDVDNEVFYVAKNGTWFNSADPAAGTGGLDVSSAFTSKGDNDFFVTLSRGGSYNETYIFNFGQDSTFAGGTTAGGNSDENGVGDFKYSVPSGFLALASSSLPEPAIGPNSDTTSDQHFNTVLWTGDGASSRAITGVGHAPDFVWIKTRNQANEHSLFDSVRGVAKDLESNSTAAEQANNVYGYINSFDSDGFTVDAGTSGAHLVNYSGNTYVGWNWKAGGTAVSNTNGSITSSVSANQDAGFSIVSYTGTGANATIGHGLASAPEMLIIKTRDSADNWPVYHAYNTSQPETDRLLLSTSDATFDNATMFNDTAPTSSVFSVGTNVSTNKSGDNFICYAFHSVEGHLKCGSYAGNGSTDGTFVYTGFRPAWIMIKRTDAAHNWSIIDSKRSITNDGSMEFLLADSTAVEDTDPFYDIISNGFKLRDTALRVNASGGSYIYLAFAESPFKYANAR